MRRQFIIVAIAVLLSACGQTTEKFCRDASSVRILEDGALTIDGVDVAIDGLAAALEEKSEACGSTLLVFLDGYGAGDRELNARVLKIIDDSPKVLLIGVDGGVEDPASDKGTLRRVLPRHS